MIISLVACKDCHWVTYVWGGTGPYVTYLDEHGRPVIVDSSKDPPAWFSSRRDGERQFTVKTRVFHKPFFESLAALLSGQSTVRKTVESAVLQDAPDVREYSPAWAKIGEGSVPAAWRQFEGKACVKCGGSNLIHDPVLHVKLATRKAV